MTARVFTSLAELRTALGEPLGPSDWLVVGQERINAFTTAASGPGYLALSLIPHFGSRLFRLDLGRARVNYGLNEARFPAHVTAGSRVRASATFADLRETAAGAALTTRYTIELDGAREPACVAETITLVLDA
ncbi:Acyl dehydratase [Nonomuraea solani]|uniref:Acyl dehydratase n=1 Tax=Nonomuraea solani TaxID=1144553 RepID=A0A1H6EUE2_9ACTN|nr:enoyl-CoA hydratase [Nonomuraea solani]SEH00983.1 Acyl dehydratase [Nonomuraea solani]